MNYKKISTGISWVLHPFLLPIYMMALLLTMTTFAHYSPNVKFYLLWVVALYAVIIPVLSLGVFLRKFMLAAARRVPLCLGVSFYWKISLHLTGMGAVVALLVVMNVVGVGNMMVPLVAAVLCAGALASARLYLGCHNGRQVLAGFCGGFTVSVLAVLFL